MADAADAASRAATGRADAVAAKEFELADRTTRGLNGLANKRGGQLLSWTSRDFWERAPLKSSQVFAASFYKLSGCRDSCPVTVGGTS